MKNIAKLLAVLLCVIVAMAATACDLPFDLPFDIPGFNNGDDPTPGPGNKPGPGNTDTPAWAPTGESVDVLDAAAPDKSVIVYGTGLSDKAKALAALLNGAGISDIGTSAAIGDAEHAIILGLSDHPAAEAARALFNAANAEAPKDYHWAYSFYDGVLAIYSGSDIGYEKAFAALISEFVTDGKLTVVDTLSVTKAYTRADYVAELVELDRIAYEANRENNKQYIDELVAKLTSQREELNSFMGSHYKHHDKYYAGDDTLMFVTHTEDLMAIGSPRWDAPTVNPQEQHPRLLINSDMYAEIRETIAKGGADAEEFKRLLNMVFPNDGLLGDRIQTEVNAVTGKNSDHNINYEYLRAIHAKALAHLIYGDDYYGYQAVYYMKNFLKSLDIRQMYNDQSRDYGYIMFSAAIVYDWCYDLLTEEDKTHFIAGVENILCTGSNANGVKMEVGFPPSALGAVSDHACEYMVLRDYLSFAVAVYGDNNSWWEYVGGRVYAEYVPVRNYYYQSGMAPQGTGVYITARFVGDIFSAWILETATGDNPYVGIENVVRSALSYEFEPGKLFNDGDGDGNYVDAKRFIDIAYIAAYLFDDPTMLAQAKFLVGDNIVIKYHEGSKGYIAIDSPLLMALSGLSDIEPADDRYEGMDLINYNGSPLGQYLAHSKWNDPAAVSVFMRIKERSTANHEHLDSGTFEIYYKGMLTSDGGVYNGYGTPHTDFYHQATISHNGLLIIDPAKKGSEGGYYSGGQRVIGSAGTTLDSWDLNTNTFTGTVTGYEHGYVDGDKSQPLYAYIAGDISKAYPSDSASYVGRRMLTVFTGDEEFPMAFFVFDDITSKAGCQRTFLLQITSPNEPTIVNNTKKGINTVTTENGEGKLVLTCLTEGNIIIQGQGGRNSGKYDATKSQNYLVNGKQVAPNDTGRDDGHWGRVEITLASPKASITFMNVLYVTDKGNENAASIEKVANATGLEGSVFNGKIAGLFASSRTGATEALSCITEGEDSIDYYVSGVAAGEWSVTVDGKDCGTYTATAEGGLLTFTAPAGAVVITPVK